MLWHLKKMKIQNKFMSNDFVFVMLQNNYIQKVNFKGKLNICGSSGTIKVSSSGFAVPCVCVDLQLHCVSLFFVCIKNLPPSDIWAWELFTQLFCHLLLFFRYILFVCRHFWLDIEYVSELIEFWLYWSAGVLYVNVHLLSLVKYEMKVLSG